MSRLRRILARAVFLGISATQGGCCCPDYELPEETIEVTDPSPELAALIAACQANPDDCVPVCQSTLQMIYDDAYVEVEACDVTTAGGTTRVHVVYYDGTACGRAPAGLVPCRPLVGDAVTRWLVRAAHLEAASVIAFLHLATNLAQLGAPRSLVDRARAAALDEVRHARAMRALVPPAAVVPVPQAAAYRARTLRALAIENAIEGCGRETLGAAVSLWQSRMASPALRDTFTRIARDELAHAELSWDIHAWALARLDHADVADVIAARRATLATLARSDGEDSEDARAILGLPSSHDTRALAAALLATAGANC